MAEKIVIAELDIDMDQVIKDTIRMKQEIELLQVQTDKAKKEQGELSSEYIQYSAALKNAQADLKTQENLVQKLNNATNTELGTIQRLEAETAALRAEQKKLNLSTDEGIARNKQITDQINKNTDAVKNNSDKQKQGWMTVGQYKDSIQQLIPGFSGAAGAADGFGKKLLMLAMNPIVAVLALIVGAVMLVVKAFKSSEESGNKLGKVFGAISGIFKGLITALKPVVDFIINNVVKTFELLAAVAEKTMALVSKGLKFLGFDGAAKAVDNFTNKVKESAKAGEQLAEMEAKLVKAMREARLIQLQYQKEAEKLRQIRDDESKSMAVRIQANKDLGALLKKQSAEELAIAQLQLDVINKRIKLEGASTENLDKRAEALTNIADIQERITGQESEQLANLNSLRKEAADKEKTRKDEAAKKAKETSDKEIEAKKKAAEEAVKLMEYELESWRVSNKEKISDSETLSKSLINNEVKRLSEQQIKEQEILKTQLDNKLITQTEYNLSILQLEDDKNVAIAELNKGFEEQERARKIEAAQIDFDNQQALFEENAIAQLDAQKALNDKMRADELAAAEKVGADISLINKKYNKADLVLEKAKTQAKLGLAMDFASNIATIAGENTAVGKAAAVAAATINTYQAATGAYAALAPIPVVGPALGIAAAAAAVASGIMNVKKILAVTPGSTPSGESASPSASGSTGAVSTLQNVNTELGQGIVSRATDTGTGQSQGVTNSVLVVDNVTSKQNMETSKNEVGTI